MKKIIKKVKEKNVYQVSIKQISGKPHKLYNNLYVNFIPTEEQFSELIKVLKLPI